MLAYLNVAQKDTDTVAHLVLNTDWCNHLAKRNIQNIQVAGFSCLANVDLANVR